MKNNWKPKLDFTSRRGMIAAAAILEGEGHEIRYVFHSGNMMVLSGTKKQAKKAFKFAIDQGWPVEHLLKVWRHKKWRTEKVKLTKPHWRLTFFNA